MDSRDLYGTSKPITGFLGLRSTVMDLNWFFFPQPVDYGEFSWWFCTAPAAFNRYELPFYAFWIVSPFLSSLLECFDEIIQGMELEN